MPLLSKLPGVEGPMLGHASADNLLNGESAKPFRVGNAESPHLAALANTCRC